MLFHFQNIAAFFDSFCNLIKMKRKKGCLRFNFQKMPQQIVTKIQFEMSIWKLKCISRNAVSFQGHSGIICLINKMSNKSSKLHFNFLLPDCSFCHTTEKEPRGHCFLLFMPAPRKKESNIQFEFAVPSGSGEGVASLLLQPLIWLTMLCI